MKNNIYLLCLALLAMLGLGSCDENETPLYNTERTALNIWFGLEDGSAVDSLTYNYSYSMDEDSITFYARVSGLIADHDRTFSLEVVDGDIDKAEGSFYTKTYTIPAGESQVECSIYFDTSKLKNSNSFTESDGDGFLCFQMTPNDTFAEGTEEYSKLLVRLRNYLAKPDNWDEVSGWPYYSLQTIFGEYSDRKYQFMIDVLGMQEFAINYSLTVPYDEEANEVSYNYANYMKEQLILALEEYNATHDEPLRDNTGALITF